MPQSMYTEVATTSGRLTTKPRTYKALSAAILLAITTGLAGCAGQQSGNKLSAALQNPTQALEKVSFIVNEGTSYSASVSPSGDTIIIDLQGELRVLPGNGGAAVSITDPLDDARLPSWSPDGKWIAYQAYSDGHFHIWIARPDGSEQRQVTFGAHDDRDAHWSPDGKTIAFSSDRNGNFDIWTLNLKSQQLQQLTASDRDEYFPAWSTDGSQLAYVSKQEKGHSLNIWSKKSGSRKVYEAKERILLPSWSPNNSQLAFHTATPVKYFGTISTHLLNLKTGKAKPLSDAAEDVFPGRISWLSNDQLVYTADGKIQRRHLANENKETIAFEAEFNIAKRPDYPKKDYHFTSEEERQVLGIMRPMVSPDGRNIIFAALGDLWLLTQGNPKPQRLTNDEYLDIDPAWSPDGSKIAYASARHGNDVKDIYIRDIASGSDTRLTQSEQTLRMPTWSPDGKTIAVLERDPNDWHFTHLNLVDVATGSKKLLHGGEFNPGQPTWSPDSKRIIMPALHHKSERFRMGANELLVIDVASGEYHRTTPTPNRSLAARYSRPVSWSPDGNKLAYISDGLLWVVPVNAEGEYLGPPQRITGEAADYPSWVGDSKSLVYLSYDKLKRVYLEDGRTEEIPLQLTWKRDIPEGRKVIHAGRLFDATSSEYRENVDIIIDGNVITAVQPHRDGWESKNVEFIDASTQTVLPGLWEAHMHMSTGHDDPRFGRDRLAFGITSVRDPGAIPYEALERRESWGSRKRVGPRAFYSGILAGTRNYYPMNTPIVSPAQVEIELERMVRLDYDFIKTYERTPHEVQKRITEFAHANGMLIASHELYPGVMYGLDVVDHLASSDRITYSDRLSFPRKIYDDVINLSAKSGIINVPTSAGTTKILKPDLDVLSLPQTQKYQAKAKNFLRGAMYSNRAHKPYLENELNTISTMADNGITMAAGTDWGGNSAFMLAWEISFLAESSLGAAGALQAATIGSAISTGVEDYLGTIEAGKLADIIIVDGDPLKNIEDLYNIKTVIKDGHRYPLSELLKY